MRTKFLSVLILCCSCFLWGKPTFFSQLFSQPNLEEDWTVDVTLSTGWHNDGFNINYMGDFGANLGVGGQVGLLFPSKENWKWGPNFLFHYQSLENSWYWVDLYLPSIGPMIKIETGEHPLYGYINWHIFGWLSTEQKLEKCGNGASFCPAGSVFADVGGYTIGIKQTLNIPGPLKWSWFASYSDMIIWAMTYNRLVYDSAYGGWRYKNRWVDVGWKQVTLGVSIRI